MPDSRIIAAAVLTVALLVPASLHAEPGTGAKTAPAPAVSAGFLDEQAREAANKQQAEAARSQLAANQANQQAVAAAEKARAENAAAMAAYEAEKTKLASDHEAKMAAWNALVAACEKNKRKICVKR
jgi:hypothetical protein